MKTYKELAKYYDLIYSQKNYRRESNSIKHLIKRYKKSKGDSVLEIACGTGGHAQYLIESFPDYTGVDLNGEMISIARKKVKDAVFKEVDMTKLRLNRKFDVILCLFSSIGYVTKETELKRTLRNAYDHLNPGGIVIIEPWFERTGWDVGKPSMTVYDGPDIKIARLSVSKLNGKFSSMDMHYLIAEKDKKIKHISDRHVLLLFDRKKTRSIMEDIGFKLQFLRSKRRVKRSIYIGLKQ